MVQLIKAIVRPEEGGWAVKGGFSEGCGNVQGCAGGVTLCGTVGGREGGGSKAGFTAEKSVERKVIAEQTGKCDTGLRAAAPCQNENAGYVLRKCMGGTCSEKEE